MSADPSTFELVVRILFLCGYALLFALAEIEIEGPHGWAERLPTWFRVTPRYARVFGLFMRGKPLTGYHAVMFALTLWSFHIGFVAGVPWTWAAQAATLAAYMVWAAAWDLIWFLLNPRFGWARFRKGEVWWHDRTWIGRFPIDYYNALVTSLVLAALPALFGGDAGVLLRHLVLVAGLAAFTGAMAKPAPAYMRWYQHMRRPGADERHLCLPGGDGQTTSAASGSNVVR